MITLAVVSHVHVECEHELIPVAYLSTQMTILMGHRYITEVCNTYGYMPHCTYVPTVTSFGTLDGVLIGMFCNPYEAGNVRDGAGLIIKHIYMKAI
jgi:hypothetical protein